LTGCTVHYGSSTSWRAVIFDTEFDGGLTEVWGPGTECGVLRVGTGALYWFGEFVHAEGALFDDELAAARGRFADWAPWVRALVEATEPDRLLRHDVDHLGDGPPGYTVGRVVLVGDAAHAMLPTIGQGRRARSRTRCASAG
jgi:2-polyprenyl-6-methoxyphenol hydroxylase-like FAD-dependent oxidoreductase